jgi:hypothetical protein
LPAVLVVADLDAAQPPRDLVRADDETQDLDDIHRRLDGLAAIVGSGQVEIAEVLEVRDQAATIAAYLRSIHAARRLQIEARELELRAERRAGLLLLDLVRHPTSRWSRWHRAQTGHQGAAKVAPGILHELGLTNRQSSCFQALGRLNEALFDGELARCRERGTPASRASLLRLQQGLVRPQTNRRTSATVHNLRRALACLERVHAISTQDELTVVRNVLALTERWAAQLRMKSAATVARDGGPAEFSCLLCSRTLVARRCLCGGFFTEVPASAR